MLNNGNTYQAYGAKQVGGSGSLLDALRLPARLRTEQVAELLGFQVHDVPLLVKSKLLRPLGGGPKNCVKYFAAVEIENFRSDRNWLERATKAVSRRTKDSTGAHNLEVQTSDES